LGAEKLQTLTLMLSISKPLKVKALNYYVHYYTTKMKDDGLWWGLGADALGLKGVVEKEALRELMRGYDPSSAKQLVLNAGEDDRTAGWDLTLSAPKSVSVLWAQLPAAERELIKQAQLDAVKKALGFLQEQAALTRRGKAGETLELGKIPFALFQDYTSRALDPALHTHALLLNVAVREDGTTGSVHSKRFFELKMAIGAVYRVELAARLTESLGLVIEADRFAFHIANVPYAACREFSKRRVQVEAELESMGASDAVSASLAALKTRGTAKEAKMEALFQAWHKVGEELGFGPKEAARLLHQRKRDQAKEREADRSDQLFAEAARCENKKDYRAKLKEAERRAYESLDPRGLFAKATAHLFESPYHVGRFKVILYNRPSIKQDRVVPRKPIINLPYLKLGPKPQKWSRVRKRLIRTRFGEVRWQDNLLFPGVPLLRGWTEPKLRWYRYTKEEKLQRKLDRKHAKAEGQKLHEQKREERQRANDEARRQEEMRRREEERRRNEEQSRSPR
jgi:conjugative relaxase-like TrwC/TraI family protein